MNDKDTVVKASEPKWPLFGYAPGHYMITCSDCGETVWGVDKRAIQCLACAVEAAKRVAVDYRASLAAAPSTSVREEVVPPVNGETDPEWRAIRRAIDQFAGRVPTISKHRAVHNEHLRQLVERLDAAGDREAADTIVWQCWYRALDRERERFLFDDARTAALVPSPDEGKRP